VRDKKHGGGSLLKVKIHILFYGDISWNVSFTVRQMEFGTVNKYRHTCFFWIIILFDEILNMAMVRNFEVVLGQTLNHSV
jgi:hypothetical protein